MTFGDGQVSPPVERAGLPCTQVISFQNYRVKTEAVIITHCLTHT